MDGTVILTKRKEWFEYMEYGLIGEKLGHSFSKIMHEKLADYTYELCPLAKDQLDIFMQEKRFKAINVTIPYKQTVLPYCDELDEAAKCIGVVNTIVNRNGKLWGYNTDLAGFLYNLKSHGIDLKDKKLMICGSGGTCKTVMAAAQHMGAKEIVVVSRTKQTHTVTYEECLHHKDVNVIVNASPKGMYADTDGAPLNLTAFPVCTAVVDVIYNPLKTKLLQQAEALGMKAVNGLGMLVAQAKFAVEHFLSVEFSDDKIGEITLELLEQLTNIVLIGMPSCGKTLTGQALSRYIDKNCVDTDAVIEERTGMHIKEIFARHGEDYFRQLEYDVITELSKQNGLIIATGGGAVKNEENIQHLKQNGIVLFIDRELEMLMATDDRPLSKDVDAIAKLYQERYPLYTKFGDLRISNHYPMEISQQETKELVNTILEGYHEILYHQWA